MTRAGVALLVFGLGVPAVLAQEPAERDGRRGSPHDHVLKMVDSYFINNLKQRLDLTDDQLARVVPHVQRLQHDRRELAQRRFRAMRELNRVLVSGGATEGTVRELLREVKAVEAEEPATLARDREAIDAVLSPVQQAKYRLLEAEVERRVRHAMSRARGGRRPARPARKPEAERQPPN